MENPGVLRKQAWSPVRKGWVIGGISGATLTIVIHTLSILLSGGGERSIGWLLVPQAFAILLPAWAVYRVLHLPLKFGFTFFATSWYVLVSVVVVNAILLALVGAGIALLVGKPKTEKINE
jgi:hypothetical protein